MMTGVSGKGKLGASNEWLNIDLIMCIIGYLRLSHKLCTKHFTKVFSLMQIHLFSGEKMKSKINKIIDFN